MTDTERDAARWRYVREFLAIEDIEAWANMRGHQPIEEESAKADGAVDVLLIEREAMAEREVPGWFCLAHPLKCTAEGPERGDKAPPRCPKSPHTDCGGFAAPQQTKE